MKSKKGFTLIELIAVIVILSIILVIGTLSIQRFITKGRNKSFDVLVNSFEDSAKTAYTECILKPNSDFCKTHKVPDYNESVTVTLGELIDAEFSDVLKNPWKTSEACDRNSTVTLTRKQDSQIVFDYETCLICGDKKSCDSENGESGNGGSNPNPEPSQIKKTLRELILEDNPTVHTNPTINTASVNTSDPSGLYSRYVSNGYGGGSGTTYFFRGNVSNNFVSFAGINWRIVRINEDGTVRLIFDNHLENSQEYDMDPNNYIHMYYTSSRIKERVDSWYSTNIIGDNASKVATGNYFCEQARVTYTYYGNSKPESSFMVTRNNYTADLTCTTDPNGKGLVNSQVGLITIDEMIFAGGYPYLGASQKNVNREYYLYNETNRGSLTPGWWTMSPAGYGGGNGATASIWYMYYDGSLDYHYTLDTNRIRPVINLKADTTATKDANGVYVID